MNKRERFIKAISLLSILTFLLSFIAPLGVMNKASAAYEGVSSLSLPVGFDYYDGNMYVAQRNGKNVIKFDSSGQLKNVVTGIENAIAVAVHPDGHLFYRGNHDVYVIKKNDLDTRTDTSHVTNPGKTLFTSQKQLTGLEFNSNGDLFVATGVYVYKIPKEKIDLFLSDITNNKIDYENDETKTTIVKTMSHPNEPYDLEFDANGNLYIIASGNNKIVKLDSSSLEGTLPIVLNDANYVSLSGISGMTFDSNGKMYYVTIPGDVKTNSDYDVTPSEVYLLGDGNNDGLITPADSLLIFQHINGKTTLSLEALKALDVNGDNNVDSQDAQLIMKKYLGIIPSFEI
jgi:sugar lactone lactonase YvrE